MDIAFSIVQEACLPRFMRRKRQGGWVKRSLIEFKSMAEPRIENATFHCLEPSEEPWLWVNSHVLHKVSTPAQYTIL